MFSEPRLQYGAMTSGWCAEPSLFALSDIPGSTAGQFLVNMGALGARASSAKRRRGTAARWHTFGQVREAPDWQFECLLADSLHLLVLAPREWTYLL